MIWLAIAIISYLVIMIWTIITIDIIRTGIKTKTTVNGLPIWPLALAMIICAISTTLFVKYLL